MGRLTLPVAFLADKSAWERSNHPLVKGQWLDAAEERRVMTCSVVRYELQYSARDLDGFDALVAELAIFRDLPVTVSTHRAAHAAMRELAAAGPLHHRVPLPDVLIAATAAEAGVAVVHCDAHFDRLATVLPFESIWLVPPEELTR